MSESEEQTDDEPEPEEPEAEEPDDDEGNSQPSNDESAAPEVEVSEASDDVGDSPELDALLETAGQMFGMPSTAIPGTLKQHLDFDITEVSEADAKKAREALEDGDVDAFCDMALEYDVNEEAVESFRSAVEGRVSAEVDSRAEQGPDSERAGTDGNQQTGPEPGPGAGDAEIERLIEQKVREAVPDATQIARELRTQMDGQQAPQQAQGQQGGQQGLSQAQLTQLIADRAIPHLLNSDGGGSSASAELGQEVQKQAMQSFIQDLNKPSLGDLIEMELYKDLAPEYAEHFKEKLVKGREDVFDPTAPDTEESDNE